MTQTIVMETGAPDYPVLDGFMGDRGRCSFVMGPLGSGKTFGAIQRIFQHMVEQEPNAQGIRPTRWCAIRNTYPDLATTTMKDFQAIFAGLGTMKMGGLEPPTFHVFFKLEDGTHVKSEVIFLALDRADADRKLRGTQVTGFWLNEVKELLKPIVDMADMRHGRYPTLADGGVACTWHGMLGDTNACDQDHWFYRLAEEDRPAGWTFYRQPGGLKRTEVVSEGGRVIWEQVPEAENLRNLPKGYYMEGQRAKKDDWIAVNLGNEYGFSVDGKPVHPEYVDSVHTARAELAVDHRYGLILGIDFGRTPAAIFWQHIEAVGRWHAIDEFCTQDMSAAIFAPELKRKLDREYPGIPVMAWCDPAGDSPGQATEDVPIQIVRAAGIPAQPVHSNSATLRRASVANPAMRVCMDGRPALLVSPKCRMFRKAMMGGFCYRRLKIAGEERYTEEPDKNIYSHPAEAGEYGLLGGGEGHEALQPARGVALRERGPRQAYAEMD